MTAPAHVLVFRPLIALLDARGWDVEVTTRDYAQTTELLERHDMAATRLGHHGGRSRAGKLRALVSRLPALRTWAKQRRFDIALAHGSRELTLAAHSLGIPSATTFDYEFATVQPSSALGGDTRRRPRGHPAHRLEPFGVRPPKLRRYPGLKEEYYLADFGPTPARWKS